MFKDVIYIEDKDKPQQFTPEQCELIIRKIQKDTKIIILGENVERLTKIIQERQ